MCYIMYEGMGGSTQSLERVGYVTLHVFNYILPRDKSLSPLASGMTCMVARCAQARRQQADRAIYTENPCGVDYLNAGVVISLHGVDVPVWRSSFFPHWKWAE